MLFEQSKSRSERPPTPNDRLATRGTDGTHVSGDNPVRGRTRPFVYGVGARQTGPEIRGKTARPTH
jgi:hypothetical protein